MLLSDICVYLNEIIPFILGDPYNFIDGAICIEMSHRCLSLYGPLAISEPTHRLRGSMAGIQLSFWLNNHDIKIIDNLFVHLFVHCVHGDTKDLNVAPDVSNIVLHPHNRPHN